jgi:hypothetical protein
MLKKFKVVLKETLTYNLEVEATTEEEATEKAFEHRLYTSTTPHTSDTEVHEIDEVDPEEDEWEDQNHYEERDHYEV